MSSILEILANGPTMLAESQADVPKQSYNTLKAVADLAVPQDLSDAGLTVTLGPFGKLARLGGLALAGMSYAPEAAAAKFPWLTPETIAKWLRRSAYTMDDSKAKSALTKISTDKFLNTTTPSAEVKEIIAKEAGRYDPYKQQQWMQNIFLSVDPKTSQVLQHEGRHRLSGLERATGKPQEVPIELSAEYGGKLQDTEWRKMANKRLKGQDFDTRIGAPVDIGNVTPLAYGTAPEELAKYVANVEVPLKNVGIMLKPEGPGFSKYDKEAYNHGYIPYGKIPAPQPYFAHPKDVFSDEDYYRLMAQWSKLERPRESWLNWVRQFYPAGAE